MSRLRRHRREMQHKPFDAAHAVMIIGGFAFLVFVVLAFVTHQRREPAPAPSAAQPR